jgi:hypothetical protein
MNHLIGKAFDAKAHEAVSGVNHPPLCRNTVSTPPLTTSFSTVQGEFGSYHLPYKFIKDEKRGTVSPV